MSHASNPVPIRFIPQARELVAEALRAAHEENLEGTTHYAASQVQAYANRVCEIISYQIAAGRWEGHEMSTFAVGVLWKPWLPGEPDVQDEVLLHFAGAPLSIIERSPGEDEVN